MKILVVSNTAWDDENSFGNTFSNIFKGMEGVEIYNVCCRNGKFNNDVVKKAVQMTDRSVLKSVYKFKYDPCHEMGKDEDLNEDVNIELSEKARKKRRAASFFIRDIIWKLGKWKKSKKLNEFLDEIDVDVIYIPTYSSKHLCNVQLYIINKLNVPVVAHISDDDFGKNPYASIGHKLYKIGLRNKYRRIIKKCAYLEVFAQNMKDEYEKEFQKPCFLIGKGVDTTSLKPIVYNEIQNKQIKFVYTGNLGDERYAVLCKIGQELDKFKQRGVLDIYSATLLTEEMTSKFDGCNSINFHGAISKKDVDKVQKGADYLIHVEGFSKRAIFSTRMSFSTKIIDYLLSGKPIFAIGPEEVNSIRVLKNEQIAIVATNEDDIYTKIEDIFYGKIDGLIIANNVDMYLKEKRDIKKIQAGIKGRLEELVNKQ